MRNNITVQVCRRLDDRLQGLPNDSRLSLELHSLRREALHEVLDNQEIAPVIDWGDTNDINSHEYVEIILNGIGVMVIQPLLINSLKELGKKLAAKAIDETTSQVVKWVISKLIKKQREKKILDFNITLKDGTFLRIDPPQGTSDVTVHFNDGELISIKYEFDNK